MVSRLTIIDAHLHLSGSETPRDVLATLDDAGIATAVVLAPFLTDPYDINDPESNRRANAFTADLAQGCGGRIIGFAVVNPLHLSASEDLRSAIVTGGLKGLKTVPTGWYPYDACALRVYQVAADLDIPILFHSGIFIDGRSGRFCRPTFFEAIRDFPSLRVTLAHLGWPWCDEAIAVGLIDLIHGKAPRDCQFRFDISFGPPPTYRREVLKHALGVLGPELIQYGSDRFLPCTGEHIRTNMNEVFSLLDELAVGPEAREQILYRTASQWLRLSGS